MKAHSKYARERQKLKNKPRKVLNLEERVQAIKLYDQNPVYQRVASVFKCSWEQIKNVICKRDEILQYYARCQTIEDIDNPRLTRQKKINFLGNVMYEFIKRAHHYRSAKLSDEVIRERALEFRDLINIDTFYPNRAWVSDFKHVYNIDLRNLNTIVLTQTPEKSLQCNEIIAYCRQEVQRASTAQQQQQSGRPAASIADDDDGLGIIELDDDEIDNDAGGNNDEIDYDDDDDEADPHESGDVMYFGDADDEIIEDEEGPTISYGDYDDYNEETDELKPTIISAETEKKRNVDACKITCPDNTAPAAAAAEAESPPPKKIKVEIRSNSNSPIPTTMTTNTAAAAEKKEDTHSSADACMQHIDSYVQALKCLHPLEDFAVYEEDFRAMNLLAQLAAVYERAIERRQRTSN